MFQKLINKLSEFTLLLTEINGKIEDEMEHFAVSDQLLKDLESDVATVVAFNQELKNDKQRKASFDNLCKENAVIIGQRSTMVQIEENLRILRSKKEVLLDSQRNCHYQVKLVISENQIIVANKNNETAKLNLRIAQLSNSQK